MREFKILIATMMLVAACLMVTPAMAGPQNGEVNHFGQYNADTAPCSGRLPESLWDEVLEDIYNLILDIMPVHKQVPQGGNPPE
jgi:hypothetical protein